MGIVQLLALIFAISAWFSLILVAATAAKPAEPPLANLGFFILGIGAFFVVYLWTFIFTLIGTIRASSGQIYRYPLTFRFVR